MNNGRSRMAQSLLLLSAVALLLGTSLSAQDVPQNTSDTVYEAGNGVTAPKGVYTPNPEYTDRARKKKVRGTVVVSMIVTPEGKVRDPKITTSLDKDLDQQALAAVSKWRLEPGTKDGRPVAVRISAEVTFNVR